MRRPIVLLVLIVVVGAGTLAALRPWSDDPRATTAPDPCAAHIDRIDLGESFERLPVKRFRMCEPPDPQLGLNGPPTAGINTRNATYGTCRTGDDAGCAPPLEVQTWRACERNRSLYRGKQPPRRRTTLRGVPALIVDEGRQVELYTGAVTVVVFSGDPGRGSRAVAALRGRIGGHVVDPGEPLPAPVPGALDGTLSC